MGADGKITIEVITREDGFLCPECFNTGAVGNNDDSSLARCCYPGCDAFERYHTKEGLRAVRLSERGEGD